MFLFLLSFGYLCRPRIGPVKSWSYSMLSVIFFICLLTISSRAALIAAVVGAAILFVRSGLKKRLWIMLIGLIILASMLIDHYLANNAWYPVQHTFDWAVYVSSMSYRWVELWQPLLSQGVNHFLTGFGKGNLYFIGNLHIEEAHNHYFLVFLESGIFGLMAFLWLISGIVILAERARRNSSFDAGKIIGAVALAATVGLCISAFVHDIFKPVLLNELWWVLIGLAAAASRISRQELDRGGQA